MSAYISKWKKMGLKENLERKEHSQCLVFLIVAQLYLTSSTELQLTPA